MKTAPRLVFARAAASVALLLACAAACIGLSACALLQSWSERADTEARAAGLTPVPVGRFLRAWVRSPAAPDMLTIYIEGDGARWRAADLPPDDPTPEDPLALHLALADPARAVGYIGRPCQYLDEATLEQCDPMLWTQGRFSETAVAMVDAAVDALVQATGARRITLIGHSGGGAMAALVAARRDDVGCLATVAAPLDTMAWTESIGVSPLRSSLNPADKAAALRAIPQVHFTGGRDVTVPPASIAGYLRAQPAAREVRVADYDHSCCWVDEWKKLRPQVCR